MDYEFTSVLDLKAHIKPALDSKVKEMQRAKADIAFWSGKTMSPEQKEILYDLPF